jgi:hypothetical protein
MDFSYQPDLAWLLEIGDPSTDEPHHPAVSSSTLVGREHGASHGVAASLCGVGR